MYLYQKTRQYWTSSIYIIVLIILYIMTNTGLYYDKFGCLGVFVARLVYYFLQIILIHNRDLHQCHSVGILGT